MMSKRVASSGMTLRFLGGIRRSKHRDEDPTTAPARQTAAIENEATVEGGRVVGWASDLGVSGDRDPFSRPNLGPWLRERSSQYDGIIWSRYDRAIRNMRDMHALSEWAERNRKLIIFVQGHNGVKLRLDFREGPLNTMQQFMVGVYAFAAQMELDQIKDRNRATAAYLRSVGRWTGGVTPYHLTPVQINNEWRLVHNPDTAPILEKIVEWYLEGAALQEIAVRLNDDGVPSPQEYRFTQSDRHPIAPHPGIVRIVDDEIHIIPEDDGKPSILKKAGRHTKFSISDGEWVGRGQRLTEQAYWTGPVIGKMLRNRVLIGQDESDGHVIRDKAGEPVQRTDPLISLERWMELQGRLEARSSASADRRTKDIGALLRISHCMNCGERQYRQDTWAYSKILDERKLYSYYKCRDAKGITKRKSSDIRCTARSIPADVLEDIVRKTLIGVIGDIEVVEERFIPGSSNRLELAEAQEGLSLLLQEASKKKGSVWKVYQDQIKALEGLIERLEAEVETVDRVELVRTGRTYRDVLQQAVTDEEFRQVLTTAGVRVEAIVSPDGVISLGRFDRPERYDRAVVMGVERNIAYAIYLPTDFVKRATGRDDLTLNVREMKVLESSRS